MTDSDILVLMGQKLRAKREAMEWSLREVATQIDGVSARRLSRIERGLVSPTISILIKLFDYYGLPKSKIFEPESASDIERARAMASLDIAIYALHAVSPIVVDLQKEMNALSKKRTTLEIGH